MQIDTIPANVGLLSSKYRIDAVTILSISVVEGEIGVEIESRKIIAPCRNNLLVLGCPIVDCQ